MLAVLWGSHSLCVAKASVRTRVRMRMLVRCVVCTCFMHTRIRGRLELNLCGSRMWRGGDVGMGARTERHTTHAFIQDYLVHHHRPLRERGGYAWDAAAAVATTTAFYVPSLLLAFRTWPPTLRHASFLCCLHGTRKRTHTLARLVVWPHAENSFAFALSVFWPHTRAARAQRAHGVNARFVHACISAR